jgi:hypothetical protein
LNPWATALYTLDAWSVTARGLGPAASSISSHLFLVLFTFFFLVPFKHRFVRMFVLKKN